MMTIRPTRDGDRRVGEQQWCAKLDPPRVREMRQRRADGAQLKVLAADYGVHITTASRICRRKNWAAFVCLISAMLLWSAGAFAQTPSLPGDKLGFDQGAGTLADAQAYVYSAYIDGATTPTLLVATCMGTTSPFACSAPLPPLLTGTHTVALTAKVVLPDGRSAESAKSAPFSFRIFAAPNAPANIKIVPGAD